ncbi:hypothetical protein WA026_009067 [Henosepilachna vigintioctopunctata]|uniref:Uncharacterized protein n=1 Tax=Henosepilachna vigintioctopunctata TaxID=420089 RepID=A0AAW1UVJ5_9CUCU
MSSNFIVYNSDIISKIDYSSLIQKSTKYAVTISAIVYASEPSFRFSVFILCAAIFSLWNRLKNTIVNLIMTPSYRRLHDAVTHNRKQVVRSILEGGGDVNVQDDRGTTALHIAAKNGDLEMLEMLLEFGADTTVEGKYGDTALNVSCTCENPKITSMLLKHGSNINHRNRFGETPLHIASKFDQIAIVKLLLCHQDVKVDSRDCYGDTALHSSVKEDNEMITKVLLEHGADITILNEEKHTVLHIAAQKENIKQIIRLMPYFILRTLLGECDSEILKSVCKTEELRTFRDQCFQELAVMQKTNLDDSVVSVYDLLIANRRRIVKFARNDSFLKLVESEFCSSSFPIYNDIIKSKFRRGWKRQKLLDKCYSIFFAYVTDDLPLICVEKIYDYFSDYELITSAGVEEEWSW